MNDYSKLIYITAVALIIAAFLTTQIQITPQNAIISIFFIILLAFPSFAAVIVWLGWKKGLILLLVLSVYALVLETLALITGIPYSEFYYNEFIGAKLFGTTPFTVPFAWLPLFIGSLYLATGIRIHGKIMKKWQIIILSTFLLLITDLVLDPGAVALQFWGWKESGVFYGVPLINFLGWVFTGFLASLIALVIIGRDIMAKNQKPYLPVSCS